HVLLVLALSLHTLSPDLLAASSLAVAIFLKQFALVALPFFVVMLLAREVRPATLRGAALVFGTVLLAGFLPFLLASPRALWDDTVGYGAGAYSITGYGLAPLLERAGLI